MKTPSTIAPPDAPPDAPVDAPPSACVFLVAVTAAAVPAAFTLSVSDYLPGAGAVSLDLVSADGHHDCRLPTRQRPRFRLRLISGVNQGRLPEEVQLLIFYFHSL